MHKHRKFQLDKKNIVCLILVSLFFIATGVLIIIDPIPQDLSYHNFAATTTGLFGIPNVENILTNIPFAIIGLCGLIQCTQLPSHSAKQAWKCFFWGITLTSLGSSYYHYNPDNSTLVWDRLPMTLAFMGLFIAILSEYISKKIEFYLLFPAILVGGSSVFYWQWSDDLRVYAMIQFFPLLAIPIVMAVLLPKYTLSHYLFYGLIFYILAKLCETFDFEIYSLIGIAGHGLKHLLAAGAAFMVILMLRQRKFIIVTGAPST